MDVSRWIVGGWALAGLVSCGAEGPTLIAADLPDEGWVAALFFGANEDLIASTGLFDLAGVERVEAMTPSEASDAVSTLLVVFDSAATEARGQPSANAPVRYADADEPTLPPPIWAARGLLSGSRSSLVSIDPEQVETLTAAWLPACDLSFADVSESKLRSSCAPTYCDPKIAQRGCELVVDTNLCQQGEIVATVGGSPGTLTSVPGNQQVGDCFAADPRDGAAFSIDCGDGASLCHFDIFDAGSPIDSAYELTGRTALLDVEPTRPDSRADLLTGYVTGLAVSGDRIAVASYDGRFGRMHCDAEHAEPGRVVIVDADSMQVVAAEPVPPCTTQLVPTPDRDGFVALYGYPVEGVLELDLAGRELRRVPLPSEVTSAGLIVTDGILRDDAAPIPGNQPAILFSLKPIDTSSASLVLSLDPTSLEPRQLIREGNEDGEAYFSLAPGSDPEEFVVLDRRNRLLINFRLGSEARSLYPMRGFCSDSVLPKQIVESRNGTTLFIHRNQDSSYVGYFGLGLTRLCSRVGTYERAGDTTSLLPALDSLHRYVVGFRGELDDAAYVSFFDADLPGFVPGELELGYGEVGEMSFDGKGRLFALLPWAAELVRIESRP